MTYNLRLPYLGDGDNYWDMRRGKVDTMIINNQPDIIGVQEAFRRQLDEITTDLPQYEWYGVARTDGSVTPDSDNEFSAILFRSDRFTRLDGGTFWLSETPDVAGSKSWDAAFPRIVTWVKLADKNSGKNIFHFNTHFDHVGVQARQHSAEIILKKINELAGNAPVVVTGDFNIPPTEKTYLILTSTDNKDHLYDSHYISITAPVGPSGSFAHNFRLDGLKENYRIDYIFVKNGFTVLLHKTDDTNWNGRLASDHLPVIAKLTF